MSHRPPLLGDRLDRRLLAHVDVEGKLVGALDGIVHLGGAEVVLVRPRTDLLVDALASLGADVTAVVDPDDPAGRALLERSHPAEGTVPPPLGAGRTRAGEVHAVAGSPVALGLPDASADAVIGAWSVYRGVDGAELAEADRVLRPAGRLVILHDYGRDDIAVLADADRPEITSWSRRGGPFLRAGFKIRVVHCWLTFESLDEATEVLGAAFGDGGRELAGSLRRPRLSYKVAIYHRSRGT